MFHAIINAHGIPEFPAQNYYSLYLIIYFLIPAKSIRIIGAIHARLLHNTILFCVEIIIYVMNLNIWCNLATSASQRLPRIFVHKRAISNASSSSSSSSCPLSEAGDKSSVKSQLACPQLALAREFHSQSIERHVRSFVFARCSSWHRSCDENKRRRKQIRCRRRNTAYISRLLRKYS